jgi:AraC-like DNA-binding protein
MMIDISCDNKLSYYSFLDELNYLLQQSAIISTQQLVNGEADPKENWHHSSPEECSHTVGRIIVYIEEHLTEQLSLEKLAEEAQLNKYQLIRLFREEQDITPWKFLISKRIDKVKELLEEGLSPGQAAVEAGFYDQSHLNRTFRERTGLTPKEYQEQEFKNRN